MCACTRARRCVSGVWSFSVFTWVWLVAPVPPCGDDTVVFRRPGVWCRWPAHPTRQRGRRPWSTAYVPPYPASYPTSLDGSVRCVTSAVLLFLNAEVPGMEACTIM